MNEIVKRLEHDLAALFRDKVRIRKAEADEAEISFDDDDYFATAMDVLANAGWRIISPPPDVAGLVEDLNGAEWVCDDERLPFSKETCRKAADALLSQAARIAELEAGLRDTPCPRPANSDPDDTTVGQCLEKGNCGCTHAALLEKKP